VNPYRVLRDRLWVKLSLAFLAIALAAIGLVAAISARATG